MPEKDLSAYLKEQGFIIPNAEIYGGLAKTWDLGPQGAELKRNLKNLWWKYFITSSAHNVGVDSQIITHPQVLTASGHLKEFCDWAVGCSNCQKFQRLDKVLPSPDYSAYLKLNEVDKHSYKVLEKCLSCNKEINNEPQKLNLLLATNLQIIEKKAENKVYLRPETCQGIFTNFCSIQRSTHRKLPFGVGQIGKSFRNEITLHHGIFRTREFEQMELEFFCSAEESEKWWNYWTEKSWNFLQKIIVNDRQKIKQVNLKNEELPHYAKKTQDLYFNYHFGWGELCSNSQRGNYDLFQHSQYSKKFLGVQENNQKIIPEVIEVSFGVERLMLAILEDSYQQEEIIVKNEKKAREVLKLPPLLTPYLVAIIPLPTSRKDETQEKIQARAYQLYLDLLKEVSFSITFEKTDYIGDAYRRQDAIGTYYCLTVDKLTINEYSPDGKPNPDYETVTLRYRDTMKQAEKRLSIINLEDYLKSQYHKFQFSINQ